MFESISPLFRSVMYAILIGFGGFLVAFLISVLFSRVTKKAWGRFTGNLLTFAIVIWTIKLILDVTGAVGVVVILGTALTGALSLGSEHLFSDLVAGVKLFTTRPFQVGDQVALADHTGEVLDITLTYIVLLGEDGNQVIVRNSDVVVGAIIKYSAHTDQKIEVQISIPVYNDLEKAIAVIQDGLRGFSPQSVNESHEPGVVCETVADGKIQLSVYAYVPGDLNQDHEKTRLMAATLRALKQNSVSLS
jgi:small-conductance mechanosensitive channel